MHKCTLMHLLNMRECKKIINFATTEKLKKNTEVRDETILKIENMFFLFYLHSRILSAVIFFVLLN